MTQRVSKKLVYKYYKEWIELYKKGAVRYSTYLKYELAYQHLKRLCPNLHMNELNRKRYQLLLNEYAEDHVRETTMDFHHHLKAAFVDAYEDGLIKQDPTRKAIIKGKPKADKKKKFLDLFELKALMKQLNLPENEINWDWFIYLISKTGLRFAEALALTPNDFDFKGKQIIINKSWNYKFGGGFQPTKNESSNRKVIVDPSLLRNFKGLLKGLDPNAPIFVKDNQKIFNSTINSRLNTLCKRAGISPITIHGLRHTHASLLLFSGVSILSVSKRLGHASTLTTQKTYLHIIQELENKDNNKVLKHLRELEN